jgi:hypothetical protein
MPLYTFSPTRIIRFSALTSVLCLLALSMGYAAIHSLILTVALLGAAIATSIFLLAPRKPVLPLAAALVGLVFIPVYWIPVKYYIFPQPGVVLLLLITLGLAGRGLAMSRGATISMLDALVVIFFLASIVPVALGIREWYALTTNLLQWLVPYLATRCLLGSRVSYTSFAKAFCASALALLPFVYIEAATGYNPFHKIIVNSTLGAAWAHEIYRNSRPRPSASMGHPIALAMYLITAAIMAAALALRPGARRRGLWLGAFGLLFIGQALTISRTGFVMFIAALVIGIVLFLSGPVPSHVRLRVARVATLGAGVIGVAIALSSSVRKLVLPFLQSDHEASTSAQARENIINATSQYFSWFGHHLETLKEVGIHSVDNTYVLLTERWGVIIAVLMASMAVPLVAYLIRHRKHFADSSEGFMGAALVGVALTNLIGLAFVAPITQEQNIIFLLLGAASAVVAHRSRKNMATFAQGEGDRRHIATVQI